MVTFQRAIPPWVLQFAYQTGVKSSGVPGWVPRHRGLKKGKNYNSQCRYFSSGFLNQLALLLRFATRLAQYLLRTLLKG
jgi:hypothetical protein